jgi:hypothetical protein
VARTRSANLFLTTSFAAIIFVVGAVQAVLELSRGDRSQVLDVFRQTPTAANLRSYETSLQESSWVVKTLRPWMQVAQFVLLKDAGEKAIVGRDGWLFYKPGVDYLTGRHPMQGEEGLPVDPLPAILAFRNDLAARGIQLLVIPAPNKASVYPEMITRRALGRTAAVCPRTSSLLARLKTSGVEVVDLFEVFREAKRDEGISELYLPRDTHWSPVGVEIAAKAVAARLLEQRWASPGTVAYETNPVTLRRFGDIVEMLQATPIERLVGPENVLCKQVVSRDTGAPYRDEPDAQILVLGDSFLRVYEQDEPGSAGFISHLARELKRPLSTIINDGGASTLVRQQLYQRPQLLAGKKLVIWEFVERDIAFGTEGWQRIPLPDVPGQETPQ